MCFYGNQTTLGLNGPVRGDSECNLSCTGNDPYTPQAANLFCGGVWRISVYAIGVSPTHS